MLIGEYPEYLVCKSLSNCGHIRKIQNDSFKQIKSSYDSLGL